MRAEVLAAHDTAVCAALGWLETRGAVTRRGRHGVDQIDTQGLVAALFRQHTSRTADPQLHTHAVIAAKVQDPIGRWLSLDARFLKGQQRTIGWIYDAALRAELTLRLGVTWEQTREGPGDLTCIPDTVRDLLSQRSGQVRAKLEELIRRWSEEHDGVVVVVVGPAGTGKTTATARSVHQLRTRGRPVIGLAPSGKAADVLAAEARCDTDTVAGFLIRHQGDRRSPWTAGTTVILDEAGMAATKDLHHLVTLAARYRWRVVAVGDPAQLPAVGRGGMFAHWCDTLAHHELVVPRRFEQQWEADAGLALRTGDSRAVEAYDQHGRLSTAHPTLIARQIANDHQHQTAKGRSVAITTNTAETARAINTEIQHRHDPTGQRHRLRLADGTHVAVGDQIATRRNDPNLRTDQDEKVRNRHRWTVTALAPRGEGWSCRTPSGAPSPSPAPT